MEHTPIAVPVVASLNISKTVMFNKENLGFQRVGF